ncbi:MAG: carbamoyltransferase HypF [Rubrivivax sp.]
MADPDPQRLPVRAPRRVLACGAFLKNRAGLLDGDRFWWSPLHGDLGTPEACMSLARSLQALVDRAGGRIDAVAHDLHPDFDSTRQALRWAHELGLPAIAVQHHHAHAALLQAEQGVDDDRPLLALTLDGVGLGSDGGAWGGELLLLRGPAWRRVAHLGELRLPGGDVAAREPWRLVAALLHAAGRGNEIDGRLSPIVGPALARGVQQMLQRDLNCPRSTAAGRWFDAAAGVLGLSVRQAHEAEAALALERAATDWLQIHPAPPLPAPSLDLLPLVDALWQETDPGRGAARFHLALADGLVQAAVQAAPDSGARSVALGGGCFFNRLLDRTVADGLQRAGLQVLRPQAGCGDAGLALGQAWATALQLATVDQPALTLET